MVSGPSSVSVRLPIDPHFTAFDHEQLMGLVAFPKNGAPGFEVPAFDIVARKQAKACVLHRLHPM